MEYAVAYILIGMLTIGLLAYSEDVGKSEADAILPGAIIAGGIWPIVMPLLVGDLLRRRKGLTNDQG